MRSTLVLAALAALAVLAPASAARAQEEPPMPPPPRKGERPTFSPPDKGGEEAEPAKPPEPPKTPAQRLVESLSTWPSAEARAAARSAAAEWTVAKPILLAALKGPPAPDGRFVAGAANAFRQAGDAEGLEPLLRALKEPRSYGWAGEVVDAVLDLDAVGAKDRLLPLLSLPSAAVVDRVARAIEPLLVPEDAPRLHALARARLPATRRAALVLSSQSDYAASRELLVGALGDPAPEAAVAAASVLGARADADLIAALNEIVRGAEPRRGAYATLALTMAAERTGAPALEDSAEASLLGSRGLRSGDPLLRACAAVALADEGWRQADAVLDPLLEKEVVPALLEVVAGTRFFPDLVAVKPFVVSRLQRLCAGTESLQTAPEWSDWWRRSAEKFVARRALTSLPREGLREALIRVEGAAAGDAGPCVFAASAEAAPPSGGAGGRFVALSPQELERVAAAVHASGLLGLSESSPEEGVQTGLTLSVEAGNRGRTVWFRAGAAPPQGVKDLLATLAEIRDANRWQALWDRRSIPTFAAFVVAERAFWTGPATDEDRALRKARLSAASLPYLEEQDLLPVLERLAANPRVGEAVRGEEASVLASYAAVGERLDACGEAALRVLAAASRTEGLPHLARRLESAPDPTERARIEDLLVATFERAPMPATLDAAAGAGPPPIRAAAVRALGARARDERASDAVRRACSSDIPEVRSAGYRAIGRMRGPEGLSLLRAALDSEQDPVARAGALEGLGALGGRDAVPLLGAAARSEDPRIRAASVRGLAATREPEAMAWILPLQASDPEPAVREEADRAMRAFGGERGREALHGIVFDTKRPRELRVRAVEGLAALGIDAARADLRALLASEDEAVGDAAAFALAWERDGEAAPRVLDALRSGRDRGRAMRCVELLSLESFPAVRDPDEAAALYAGWYEVSRARGPRGWLANALAQKGLGDETLKDFESGTNPRAAVPALLKALRDTSWSLRRAAALELARHAGRDFGDIGPWTPRERGEEVAGAWDAWWAAERGPGR
jgi:HEAT repeat protein